MAEILASTLISDKKVHCANAKGGALLLAPAPLEALKNELDIISELGPHYYATNVGLRIDLREDSHADQLRATLMNVNSPMDSASRKLDLAFAKAHNFYAHEWEEPGEPISLTKEVVGKLLEPEFQATAIGLARDGATQAALAAKQVREDVIPILHQVESDLENYLVDYSNRVAIQEARKKSWIPSFLLNLIWGRVDPTPWSVVKVQELPQRLESANHQLRRLPIFFDNLELHFRRLSDVQTQQLTDLGYTTFDDLTRLYKDRMICIHILHHMENSWYSARRAFIFGAAKDISL